MMGYSTDQGSIPCGISTLTGIASSCWHRQLPACGAVVSDTSFPTTPAGSSNVLTRRACTGTEEAPDAYHVRGFFLCVGPVDGGLLDGVEVAGSDVVVVLLLDGFAVSPAMSIFTGVRIIEIACKVRIIEIAYKALQPGYLVLQLEDALGLLVDRGLHACRVHVGGPGHRASPAG